MTETAGHSIEITQDMIMHKRILALLSFTVILSFTVLTAQRSTKVEIMSFSSKDASGMCTEFACKLTY